MEIQELLDEIDATHPGIIGRKVPEPVATALLRAAFQVVRKQVEKVDEGQVQIKGLGVFRVKSVERGEGKDRVTRKVVSFRFKQGEQPAG
jgi:nucleoid DNA-binding protein